MSFATFIDEQRRLLILQALNEAAAGEQVSAQLLHAYCVSIALKPTRAQVEADLLHLESLRLIERRVRDSVVLACITQMGRDVAAGRAQAPGVADQVVR